MTPQDLKDVLTKHRLWIAGRGGEQANLRVANLREAYLSGADLRRADLTGANLGLANLRGADLRGAKLTGAAMSRADLIGADLSEADLTGAVLRWADLSGAVLHDANLIGADMRGAGLHGAYLSGAVLTWVNLDFASWPLSCGSIGVKLDERQQAQLLYHALAVSPVALALATPEMMAFANGSHVVQKHGYPELRPIKAASPAKRP